jgi:ubiquinone/menaquinone biosynthesis C-methylase UbiE
MAEGASAGGGGRGTGWQLAVYRCARDHPALFPSLAAAHLVACAALGASWPVVTAAAALAATGFVWGYATRALRPLAWRPAQARDFRRGEYGSLWDALSGDLPRAAFAVAGASGEAALDGGGREAAAAVIDRTAIAAGDVVVEIGCGIGRIAAHVAPRCARYVGVDVAANMLALARRRLVGRDNVGLVLVGGNDLAALADASADVVFATVVFPHIDEWDRWRYVSEAFRVLRPGGRLYVDNVDLEGDLGWSIFDFLAGAYRPPERPPHISRASTGAELAAYLERAGFGSVALHRLPPLVAATGVKPVAAPCSG